MPIYIPPLVKKVEIGKIPTNIEDISDVYISNATSGDALVYNGAGLWVNEAVVSEADFINYQNSVTATTEIIQSDIVNLQVTDANLQQEINQIWVAVKLVFSEDFVGNGTSTSVSLSGNITNGTFISGGWNTINVVNTLPVDITDLNGSPIYDSNNYFTRQRIAVTTVGVDGTVNFNYAPQLNQAYKLWYFYSLTQNDRIQNYYREDHVASMEEAYSNNVLASQVMVNTAAFNKVLTHFDTTVQAALDTIDDHTHNITTLTTTETNTLKTLAPNGSGGITWINQEIDLTISGGVGILATENGNEYIISVKDYISKTDVTSISGSLQSQIDTLVTDTITVSSSGGSILVNKTGVNYNLEVATAPIQSHNNLLGLQGGTAGEYYHLTQTEYSNISGASSVNTSVLLPWKYSNSTSEADPSNGNFALNNLTISASNKLFISRNTNNGIDSYNILKTLGIGDKIYLQNSGDATEAIIVTINGTPIDNTSWFDIPYTIDSQATATTFTNKKVFSFILINSTSLSNYTLLTTTASLTGALDARLTIVENTYASKASPISGTYNNVVINSQGIVTSGGNIVYTIPSDLNPYTLLSTTQGVSATLNTSINNEATTRYNADVTLQSEINNITGGSFVLDSRYSKTSDIVVISGGLNTSITNETNARISGDSVLQSQITTNTGIIQSITGNYTLLTTTASLTGSLNASINNEASTRYAGDIALQSEINNITGGSFVLDTRYSKTSDIVTISGGLNTSITNEATIRYNSDVSLQSEINNITGGSFVLDTRYSKTSDIVVISGGLDSRLITVENNYATKATPNSGTYNNVVVNSQGIVTSGGNIVYATPSDFSVYTLLSTTQGVSSTLNTSINNEATTRYNSDVALQSEINNITGGSFVLDSRYSKTSDITVISGGLNTSITNEATIRYNADIALQSEINNITGGSFVLDTRYSKTSDIVVITGGLNTSITNEATIRYNSDVSLQSEINNITGGSFVLDSRYAVDSNVVHKTGNETINGIKTFNDQIIMPAFGNADSTFNFTISGANAVLLTSKKIGINTSNPGYNLDIGNSSSNGVLRSWKYILGTDLSIIPVQSGQSGIGAWWGIQLLGNRQSSVDAWVPANIGAIGDYGIIMSSGANPGKSIVGIRNFSTYSGNLLTLENSSGTTLANVDTSGNISSTGTLTSSALAGISGALVVHNVNGTLLDTGIVYTSLATKASPTAGTYNNVVVNSQGIVTSGGNIVYAVPSDFSVYTLLTTTQGVSSTLNTSINNEALARTNADALLTPLTTTANISAGFNVRIGTLETNTAGITGGITQLNSTYVKLVGGNLIYGDQTIFGNINIVSGSINQVSVTNLNVEDQYVLVNSIITGSPILNGGLQVNRGTSSNAIIEWNEPTQKWIAGVVGSEQNIAYTNDLIPYTLLTTTQGVSSTLNTSINNEALARTNADALLTPITTTASISGNLNGRLVTVENNYATKATPIAGTYNNVVVNSQGIVSSGGNIIYTVPSDLSVYTLLSTTASISGNLQGQIDTLVLDTISITSSGGSILVNKTGVNYNLEVAKVGLQGRVVCTTATEYTINHATVNPATDFPVVSLEVANNNSDLFIQGIYDRTATSFKVVLSGIPDSSNAILYHLTPTASIDLTQYVLKSDLNTVYSISGSSVLTNTQHNIIQTSTPIVTTLWSTPTNGDFINILNDTTSGENVISGNGKLIEGDYSFIIYYGESFTFRYNGTAWKAF